MSGSAKDLTGNSRFTSMELKLLPCTKSQHEANIVCLRRSNSLDEVQKLSDRSSDVTDDVQKLSLKRWTVQDVPDLSLKRCRSVSGGVDKTTDDLLSDAESLSCGKIESLSDDLLSRLLSFVPAKDAAAISGASKRMRRIFSWIPTLDLDDSPISHCSRHPHLTERFATFTSFVDNVLKTRKSKRLSRFRLQFGGNKDSRFSADSLHRCYEACLPDLEPSLVNAWISFPLSRSGLRELDLSIHIRKPCKLPREIFACETLEVLKLDMSLDVDQDCCFHRLPNLKVLHLSSFVIYEDGFITRLVSSCPVLVDLAVDFCWWMHSDSLTIRTPSLQRLGLNILKEDDSKNSDMLLIDDPNLQYFLYSDNLACQYTVTNMKALVKADICLGLELQNGEDSQEASLRSLLSLLRPLSNVQHLSLNASCLEILDYLSELRHHLPVFDNLKYLEVDYGTGCKWNNVILGILHSTPRLETLAFPKGLDNNDKYEQIANLEQYDAGDCYVEDEAIELERQCWRTTRIIPSCYTSHLKRIVIYRFWGIERELNLVEFLLKNVSSLEELDLRRELVKQRLNPVKDRTSLLSILMALPKASSTCSIKVE